MQNIGIPYMIYTEKTAWGEMGHNGHNYQQAKLG